MNNKTTTLITAIFLISTISALSGGECNSFNFPNSGGVTLEIKGNSSNMDGFSWNKTDYNITYCLALNFKADNFTLNFSNTQEEVIIQSGGGGSSSSSSSSITTSNPTATQMEAGYSKQMKVGEKINFNVGTPHTLKIIEITKDSVTIEIRSDPLTIHMMIGETKEVLMGDKILYVYLESIKYGKANIRIMTLNLENVSSNETISESEDENVWEIFYGEETDDEGISTWLRVLIASVVAILIILIIALIVRKGGKD